MHEKKNLKKKIKNKKIKVVELKKKFKIIYFLIIR